MLKMKEEEEQASPLECSSGCESGWTTYLENQSFGIKPTFLSSKEAGFTCKTGGLFGEEEEEEEKDLSMVSDASSGPPHFHDNDDCFDENGWFYPASLVKKNSKRRRNEALDLEEKQQQPSLLDDTASSHVFSFSKSFDVNNKKQASMDDVLDFSMGFSATHFKAKPTLQKQYGFLHKPPKSVESS